MNKLFFILFVLFSTKAYCQVVSPIAKSNNEDKAMPHTSLSEMGMDSIYIYSKVDSIVRYGIKNNAFPGAQVLVAKNGAIVFHESYGYHTYDNVQAVSKNDIYDLASVTKIAGPLPAIMKLVDEGKLDLDKPFSNYWKAWEKIEDKKDITLREILAHQAGLAPYFVFLNEVKKKNGKLKRRFVRTTPNARFNKQAFDHLYVKRNFNRRMYRVINKSKVSTEKKYKYSGITFLIFPELIEQLTGQSYEEYLTEHFYAPLGASSLGFNPKTKGYSNKIVPTEVDTIYRYALTLGWVHDENASLLGGVSGNAGLFGTADDLVKLMQMYQNYGVLNEHRYISETTIKEFTKIQYPENENRRGLGFDKPLIGNAELNLDLAYPAPEVSEQSFGHAGFTGTFVWADPERQLVFIFLSNRVYPTRENRNLYKLSIRGAIQQVFYNELN